MDFVSLKRSFFSYLEENGKLEEINTGVDTEGSNNQINDFDISIFQYANEFKSFLQSEYDTSGINLMGKSISDILDMEIEAGKLVDNDEEVQEVDDEEYNEEIENDEESEKIDENPVIEKVEDNLEDELASDMSSAEAGNVVDGFENDIASLVDEQVQQGEMDGFDIFKDVFNELTESSEFINTIDTNKSNDIDKEELETFLNSIKGFDNNDEDVSVDDLLTAASQIQEGKFTFISTGNNSTDSGNIQDTDSVSTGESNVSTEDSTDVGSTESIEGSSDGLIGDDNIDIDIPTDDGNMDSGSSLDGGIDDSGNLGSMTDELDSLQQEKEETETDLSEQTDKYNSTQDEKEQVVGDLSSEIETGSSELTDAQDEVSNAAQEKDNAESDVESAQQETQCSKAEADEAEQALTDAQNQTCESQNNANSAEENNQQAIQEEQDAQNESTTANNNLTTAVGNTNAAQGNADTKSGELQTATVEASEAFSVLNIKNQEVSKAQSEYNNAKAQQDNSNKNIFQKIASWVSSLFNKLQDAIMQRDKAQAEADRKEAEQEKAQIASDEALEALEQRKKEQDEAQSVADAAQVVLERATGEREVSDQEYAEALVVLASSMEAEENAESEYTTAFDNYLQCNNYQIDAEGRLQDANGNYISATQVAQELETYVQGLVEARDTKEKEYDDVIVATASVIAGDKEKIDELDTKIKDLETKIQQEKEDIALQEAMITELSTEQSEINAANASGGVADGIMSLFGFGSAKDQKELNDKKAILEEALLSGDSQKIAEAYKAIYGDKEVVVDASGKVVDTSELSEEELAKCSVVSVKDLSNDNLTTLMHNEAAATENTVQTIDAINNGSVICDGEEISMEEINSIIQDQVAAMAADMDDAVSQQGIISSFAGGLNKFLGIGTSETEARAQIEVYQELAAQLNSCTDPVEYAALFKQITGRDFNLESVTELYAYDKVSKGTVTSSTTNTDNTDNTESSDKIDITSYVDSVTDTVNEDESLDKDSLSMTKDNPAREAIEDYKETQETAKDAVVGVVSGVVSTAVVTVCSAAGICAAPFTAGASLGLVAAGFAIAGATGAAVSTGLNAVDSIYDKDGDGSLDFNYSWKEAGKDALIGSLNGIVGNLSNGVGAAVTGKISTQATQTAVTTTLRETINKGATNLGGKVAGAAVEGFIDGSISSSGEYAINALMDENVDFSLKQFAETGLQGGLFGSVFNVGLTTASIGLSSVSDAFKAKNFEVDVNEFLANGTTNNKLAEMVAGKLDDSLLDSNGMINHYAAGQLMKNAETALDSLETHFKTLGLDTNDAIKVLDSVPLSEMPNVPTMISALSQLDISGIDMTTVDGVSDGLRKIDDVKLNENGTLSSMKVVSDGQEITFEFDKNGKLDAVGISNNSDDIDIDVDDDIHDSLIYKYVDMPIETNDVIDKINKLVDLGKLPEDIDYTKILNDPTHVNTDFYNDLTKLYNAYAKGIDVQKVFVPEFSSLDDAVKAIKVGDVCTVNGGNSIAIKLADGTIQNLNISAETYMELFPPVKRFASMQGGVGDCYLVSSLDLIYKTPETRVKLLQCFSEQPDGSIIVKVGDIEVKFNNAKDVMSVHNHKDYIGKQTNIDGANGFKMLEEAFGFSYINKKTDYLVKKIPYLDPSSKEYKEAIKLLTDLQDPNMYIGDVALLARANGGYSSDVFEIFGLKNSQYISTGNKQAIYDIFLKPKNWDKYILSLASKGKSDRLYIKKSLKLAGRHAYGVEPLIYNGEVLFKITNPWDSAAYFTLRIDEIFEYFDGAYIAEKV